MKAIKLFMSVTIIAASFIFYAFTAANINSNDSAVPPGGEMNDLWKDYTSWYKVTGDTPNTGDPTGFLDSKHKGIKAIRVIYINDIGKDVNTGTAPYKYPEGTVVVKESYKNQKAFDAKKTPELTIMVKLKAGGSPETGDWGFVMGGTGDISTGTGKMAKFCGDCHVFAAGKDYLFINSDFLKNNK